MCEKHNNGRSALSVFFNGAVGAQGHGGGSPVFDSENSLIHNQLNQLRSVGPDALAGAEPERGQMRVFAGSEVKIARLLSDWSWIHRRVETIALTEKGQTRREISVDFTYPRKLSLPLTVREGETDCAVPIAMLRKGSLNGLNCKDSAGSSVSVLGSDINSEIAYRAAMGVLKAARVTRGLEAAVDEICVAAKLGSGKAAKVIECAVLDTVLSGGGDDGVDGNLAARRTQDVHRHNLFSNLALMFALQRGERNEGQAKDLETVAGGVAFSFWQKGWKRDGLEELKSEESEQYPSVLDSSAPIQVLAMGALKILDQPDSYLKEPRVGSGLETFFNLLSTLAISYPFCVRMSFPSSGKGVDDSPGIVKISMDVQVSDDEPGDARSSLAREQRLEKIDDGRNSWSEFEEQLKTLQRRDNRKNCLIPLLTFLKRFRIDAIRDLRSGVSIPFRFCTLGAGSTHVEVALPQQTKVKDLTVTHGPKLKEATGTDLTDSARAVVLKPKAKCGLFHEGDSKAPSARNYDCPDGDSDALVHEKHGTFFQSQSRAHLNASRSPATPLESVRMIMQVGLGARVLAAQSMVALLALAGMVSAYFNTSCKRLGVAEIAGITTLIVTFFLVILVTGYLNRTVKLLHHDITRQISVYAVVSISLVAIFFYTSGYPTAWLMTTNDRLSWGVLLPLLIVGPGNLVLRILVSVERDKWVRWLIIVLVVCAIIFALHIRTLNASPAVTWTPFVLLMLQGLMFWWATAHLIQTLFARHSDSRNWSEDESEQFILCKRRGAIARPFRKFNAITETGPWDAPYLTAELAANLRGKGTLQEYLRERHEEAGISS